MPYQGGLVPPAWELRVLTWIPFSNSGGGKIGGGRDPASRSSRRRLLAATGATGDLTCRPISSLRVIAITVRCTVPYGYRVTTPRSLPTHAGPLGLRTRADLTGGPEEATSCVGGWTHLAIIVPLPVVCVPLDMLSLAWPGGGGGGGGGAR